MMWFFVQMAYALEVPADSLINRPDSDWRIEPTAEIGFVRPIQNDIQFGQEGYLFDYVKEGGQDNLFLYTRWAMNFRYNERHVMTFLYQPLNLRTTQEADGDFQFNSIVFTEGTPLELRYGFDYYRASYTYDILEADDKELSFGVSMQIRNATIDITSTDGVQRESERDIGLVPLLKTRGRFELSNDKWVGFELDGSYAPIKYLNGDVSDVVGALVDTSVHTGLKLKNGIDPFLNVRYVAGGAEGTTNEPDPGEDGFIINWVQFVAFNIGFQVR